MPRARGECGFLLIGVIMFVLALSILGLSLYSLSSYEAQFTRQSHDNNTALYKAQGGLEMVKAILATPPYPLKGANKANGHEGVVWANAFQLKPGSRDSIGTIDFTDTVHVTILTNQGGQSRSLEAQFLPSPKKDYYKRLFTIATDPFVVTTGGSGNRNHKRTVQLTGRTWQYAGSAADTGWAKDVTWSANPHFENPADSVRVADVPTYFAAHPVTQVAQWVDTTSVTWKLSLQCQTPKSIVWFRAPHPRNAADPSSDPVFDLNVLSNDLEIAVKGTAILELPHGARFNNRVHITGTGAIPTLVIVGQRNGLDLDSPEAAIWFFSGLAVDDNVNVVFATDAQVKLEFFNPGQGDGQARNLSVFARQLWLLGPQVGDGIFDLQHPSAMDSIIDGLYARGALPLPATAISNTFAFVRGSWRETKP